MSSKPWTTAERKPELSRNRTMRTQLGPINRLVAVIFALVWGAAGVAGLVVAYVFAHWVAAVAALFAFWYALLGFGSSSKHVCSLGAKLQRHGAHASRSGGIYLAQPDTALTADTRRPFGAGFLVR
jgi:hypothetical protein